MDSNSFKWLLAAVILLGLFVRIDLWLYPANDELLYTASAIQKYQEYFSRNPEFANFAKFDLVEVHPPVAKIIMATACFATNCTSPVLHALGTYWIFAMPFTQFGDLVKNVMPVMRAVNVMLSILLAAIVYYLLKRHFDGKVALAGAFAVWFSPNVLLYANNAMLEMGYVLFFAVSALYYALEFYDRRTWQNAAILGLLLALSFNTKQYLPLLIIPAIVLLEAIRYVRTREVDFKAPTAVAIGLLGFKLVEMFLSHLAANPQATLSPEKSLYFNLQMPLLFLARLEIISLVLVPIAAYLAWKAGWLRDLDENPAFRLLLVLVVLTIPFIAYGSDRVATRYALPNFVIAAAFGATALAHGSKNAEKIAAALGVIAAVYLLAFYPYYDNYENPLGYVLPHVTTERQPSIGMIDAVKRLGNKLFITNDAYGLPYWGRVRAPHVMNFGLSDEICSLPKSMYGTLKASNGDYFAFRKFEVSHIMQCPSLNVTLEEYFPKAYDDKYWSVYDLKNQLKTP